MHFLFVKLLSLNNSMVNKVNVDFLYNVYFMQMETLRLNPWKEIY